MDPNEVRTGKTVEPVGVAGRNPRGSHPPLLRPTTTTSTPTPASSGTLRIRTTPVNPMGPSRKYSVSAIIWIKSEPNTRSRPLLAGIQSRQSLNQDQGVWILLGPSNEGPHSVMPRPPHVAGVLGHLTFPIGDPVRMRSSMTGRGDPNYPRDPDPSWRGMTPASGQAKCGKQGTSDGTVGVPVPSRGDRDLRMNPEPRVAQALGSVSAPPQMFFLAVVSQSVYWHGGGPDRSLCPCICISGTRRPCPSPSCSCSWSRAAWSG